MKRTWLLLTVLLVLLTSYINAQTFSGSGGAIPDNNTQTCFNVNVTGVGTINGSYGLASVCININHTWTGDLDIFLRAPDGTMVELSTDNGGSGDNYTNTCFSMSASTSITAGTAPFTGSFRPEGNLGAVNNGQNANGVWQLCVTDDAAGDVGSVVNFSLTFNSTPAPPPPPKPACSGNPPAGNTCATATPICEFNGYCGNTSSSYTSNYWSQLNTAFCGSIENNSFLSFQASSTTVTLNVWVENALYGDGIQMFFFRDPDCSGPLTAAHNCYSNITPGGPTTVTATGLTVGQTYLLMIDGYAGDVANYTIQAATGVNIPVSASGATTICAGQSATLTAAGGNGVYSWSTGGVSVGSGASITVSPTTTTTYTVTSTSGNTLCPSATQDFVTVTVNTAATITAADPVICSGQSTTITTSVSNGGGAYSWSNGLGTGATSASVSPTTTTNYTVYYTRSGCTSFDVATVTVNPVPTASGGPGNITVCAGQNVSATSITLSPSAGSTLTWTNSNTAIGLAASGSGQVPGFMATNSTSSPISATITVTPRNGSCNGTPIVYTITVNPQPNASFTVPAAQCLVGNSFNFSSAHSTGNSWNFGASATPSGSTAQNPSGVTFNAAGTFPVTHTVVLSGCTATVTNNVTVNANPTANAGSNTTICSGQTANLGASASGGLTYSWSPATGLSSTTVSNPTATLTNTGSSPINQVYTLTVTNSSTLCSSTATVTVTVNPLPDAAFTVPAAQCLSGNSFSFSSAHSTGNTWTFGASASPTSSTAQNPSGVTFSSAGTFPITHTVVQSGCTATVTNNIVVNPNPTANPGSNQTVCSGVNANLGASSVSGQSYSWSPATGLNSTTVSNPVATLTNTGSSPINQVYTLTTITTATGCSATATVTVTVNPPAIAQPGSNQTYCSGETVSIGASSQTGYTYSWSPSTGLSSSTVANPTVSLTNSGTTPINQVYNLTATNSFGCQATGSVTVTVNPSPVANAGPNAQVCSGNTVSIGSSNVAGYTYSWAPATGLSSSTISNPIVSLTNTGSSPVVSSYTVFVSIGSCSNSSSVNVTVNPNPTATVSGTNVSCFGASDGTASVSPSGGLAPYTYSWVPGGATTASVSGLSPNDYTVYVTDSRGCVFVGNQNIIQPAALTQSGSITHVLCNGNATGAIDVTPGGGSGTLTYSWSNGANTQDLTGVAAGSYTLTITDQNSCVSSANYVINTPTPLNVTSSITDAGCSGSATGAIDITVSGATPGYTYSWSNGATTQDITGLNAGTYTVVITDANSCVRSYTYTVSQPGGLTASLTPSHITCNGLTNGAINTTASGGTGTLTYSWSNGATTANLSGLGAGTYDLIITDGNGCTFNSSVTINQPPLLTANLIPTDILCAGSGTGAIDLTVGGGTPGYTYTWSNGSFSEDLSGLTAGVYSVVVRDNNGCTANASVSLTEPAAMQLTTSSTNANCGASNGSASVSVIGGAAPYAYSWSAGSTSNFQNGLSAGSYTVMITDDNGCQQSATVNVSNTGSPTATIQTVTDVSCFGGADGSASLTVSGGVAPYTYTWSPSGGNGASASGLTAGNYVVNILDDVGCATSINVTITQPSALNIVPASVSNVSCNGGSDGSISVNVSGGSGTYTYSWVPGGGNTSSASGLSANNYTVYVQDGNGCSTSANYTINQPDPVQVSLSSISVLCHGGTNGGVSTSVSGGTPPYINYTWSNGSTSSNLNNVPAGTYSVTVTDNNGCSGNATITVNQPAQPLALAISSTNASCGASDGTANVSVNNGTAPYTYTWSNGQNTAGISGLTAGTYSITVVDDNGCWVSDSVVISNTMAPTASIASVSNVTCHGFTDGSASIMVAGGVGSISYAWVPGGYTTSSVNTLAAGSYTVTVTDSVNCSSNISVVITEPPALNANISGFSNPLCHGGSDGTAVVTANGGTSPYTYTWSNGLIGPAITGLSAGNYSVNVVDNNGCTTVSSITLSQPSQIDVIQQAVTHVSCFGGSDGLAAVQVSGGVAPYSYSWTSGVSTSDVANNLLAGNYTVYVTDFNGCSSNLSIQINQPLDISINGNIGNALCNGGATGSVDVSVSGGTAPYTYSWSNGAITEDISSVAAGSYTVLVIDSRGCSKSENFTVSEAGLLTASLQNVENANCGLSDGSAQISVSGGTSPYTFTWSNGQYSQHLLGVAAGDYSVVVRDSNNCSTSLTLTVGDNPKGNVTLDSQNPSCPGVCNGSIIGNISGGTPPFSFDWSNGSTNQQITGLCNGVYSLIVTDFYGCKDTAEVTLINGPAVSSTIDAVNNLCNGGNTAYATVTAIGGSPNFTYSWSNGQTGPTATNLAAGTYTVMVTDEFGCSNTNSVTITEPSALASTYSKVDVSCFGGSNGQISLNVSGGTPGYTYTWTPNVSVTNLANSLIAGSYNVQITDSNNCSIQVNVNISEPTPLTGSLAGTPSNCTTPDGSITSNISGGTPPYIYSWSNGDQTPNLININGGNYNLLVTDSNGCTLNLSTTVATNGGGDAVIANINHVSCFGLNDGSVTVSIGGGFPPYTYSWNDGQNQTTPQATNLAPGVYTVTVTDSKGCIDTAMAVITEPSVLDGTVSSSPADCFGVCNGSAQVIPSGGTAPYTFSWSDVAMQSTAQASNLCEGTYLVQVTDSKNCTVTKQVTVLTPSSISINTTTTPAGCTVPNGTASVTANGGNGGFTFLWSTGAGGAFINGLAAGAYYVVAIDSRGCRDSVPVSIATANGPTVVIDSVKNLSCFNSNDGVVYSSVVSGLAPFQYSWSNGVIASPIASGLSAGLYSIEVTDSNGCVGSVSVTVTQPDSLQIYYQKTDPTCVGSCNGSASSSVVGGTVPYTYLWDNGVQSNTNSADNLCAGVYTLTVVDKNNCIATSVITIENPPLMIATATPGQTLCNNSCDGSSTVSVINGTPPYTYSWTDVSSQTSQTATGLCAGSYMVYVKDINNCETFTQVNISNAPFFELDTTVFSPPSCFGLCDGRIEVMPVGGNPPYSVQWNDPQNQLGFVAENLCAGSYTAIATDANGCEANINFVITQPSLLVASISKTDATCYNSCDGTATVNVGGGTPPYSYNWTPSFQNTPQATNLCSGTHSVTVTDANNCVVVSSTQINQPQEITVSSNNVTPANCQQSNGGACVLVSGGVQPLTYSWSNGQTGACLSNVTAGSYNLSITDANGCLINYLVAISNINGPTVTIPVSTNVSCFGLNDGTATASIVGGTPPYTVLWNDPSASQSSSVSNLPPGDYAIQVTDNAGCIGSATVTITQDPEIIGGLTNFIPVSCPGICNGSATVTVSGGVAPYTYTWNTNPPQYGVSAQNLCEGNNTVVVKDSKGCEKILNGTVSAISSMVLNTNVTPVRCSGMSNGQVFVSVTGGTPPYVYNWSPSISNTQAAGNLSAGDYNIEVFDSRGCVANTVASVTEPLPLILSTSTSPSTCNLTNGTAQVMVSGGTPGYSYFWNPTGQTSPTATGLMAGNHFIVVTDQNNCTANEFVNVGSIQKPTAQVTTSHVNCFGEASGSADVTIVGGTSPYTYSWVPSNQNVSNPSGLAAGVHTVYVVDATGCQTSGIGVINQPAELILNTSTGITLCDGQAGQIYATATGGTPGYSYSWLPGDYIVPGITVQPISSTVYSVTVTDSRGCVVGPKPVSVNIRAPLTVSLVNPDSICLGESVTLQALASGGLNTYAYSWIPQANSSQEILITPPQTGIYSYTVIVQDGCSRPDTASTIIKVNPVPAVSLTSNIFEGCAPLTVNFQAVSSLSGTFSWNFGNGATGTGSSSSATYVNEGFYDVGVTFTSTGGCAATKIENSFIHVFPVPVADFNYSPSNDLDVFNSTISFFDASANANNWFWNFGDSLINPSNYTSTEQNPIHFYPDSGRFCISLKIKSEKGCVDTALKCLYVKPNVAIYIPNAFTPNEDGINEGFKPIHVGIVPEDYKFMIFDRWGNLIFQTTDINASWDGTIGGDPCQIDTYVYKLQCKDIFNNPHNYTGQVHLVR